MRHVIVAALVASLLSPSVAFAEWKPRVKKPSVVRTVQREAQRVVDSGRRAVKGQVRIRVHNATDGEMTLTASVGRQKITVDPGKTGTYTKANIGDSVIVYANGKTLKSLGILHKNVYDLTYRN